MTIRQATRKLRDVLKSKGYPMEYIEVREGHNWSNWKPLIDDVSALSSMK